MRLVQLSDIHLSKDNLDSLKDYYMESLLEDLLKFHNETPIDLILITGDLVDKGGESFGQEINPYQIFRIEVIDKIISTLDINVEQILMIPGNHDIQRSQIEEDNEYFLNGTLSSDLANERSELFHDNFNNDNKRISRFKEFEKNFHKYNTKYLYSNNESLLTYEKNGLKVGIALINDSWRCSASLKKDKHFIGYRQLFRARNYFNKKETSLNIAVFHHPLNAINDNEREEITAILKTKNFDIAIFGHSHRHQADQLTSSIGGFLSLHGRSAFSVPKEQSSVYQPGYNILDVDIVSRIYSIYARKFISSDYRYDKDTDALPDGFESRKLPQNDRLFPLADDSNNEDKDLPDSYTADVDRIVSLLIGESIYPDKYSFVRELIQNSVDACNRIKERHSHLIPKIFINIDSAGNYIDFNDDGDGMSKNIVKNHFAVLGKSISQDYNDNSGKFNLISKFGIGFISTFIAGEKVVINTNSEEDGQISFEIENVFKGFKYIQPSTNDIKESTGTNIRVYLKKGFDTNVAYRNIRNYCRHIENLEIKHNDSIVKIEERWNIEDTTNTYINKTHQFELRLGLGVTGRNITASYCGFLITNYPHQIIPHMFPILIGGEINFSPKSIDFDISRTNIIPTIKAEACRREISVSIRKLFRKALEGTNNEIYKQVVNYLHYYLQNFDAIAANLESSYNDFYSKKELISLCCEHTYIEYNNKMLPLSVILTSLKARSIDKFYLQSNNFPTDYELIVIEYLKNKGNLIIRNANVAVNFHASQQQVANLAAVIQIIGNENGISMQSIMNADSIVLSDMKLNKTHFDEKLQLNLANIEAKYHVSIEIGMFSKTTKPSVRHADQIFLNNNHDTFQSLLKEINLMKEDAIIIYLLGLLGLKL